MDYGAVLTKYGGGAVMAPPSGKRKRNAANTGNAGPKSKKGRKKAVATTSKQVRDSSSEPEDEWVVQEVLDKRITNGTTEYKLRWKNWDPDDLTWEPVHNLNCPDLIEKFEDKQKPSSKNGFTLGYTPRAVKGVVQIMEGKGEKFYYLVEWEDHDEVEKIPGSIVREKIPQEVIKFLVSKVCWENTKAAVDHTSSPKQTSSAANSSAKVKSDNVRKTEEAESD